MIPCMIGVRTQDNDVRKSAAMQTWLEAHGLCVYNPHTYQHGESSNLTVEYNPATRGLDWKPATVAHLASLPAGQMVMSVNAYFYGAYDAKTYRTIGFPDPANPARRLNQDELSPGQLAGYWTHICRWLEAQGVRQPRILIDEPPHMAGDPGNAGKYGWSPAVEARVIKLVRALLAAGFGVLVAMPGPSQLRFWAGRLPGGVTWLLNEKHTLAEYDALPAGAPVWVYNVRAQSWADLPGVLSSYKAVGMLQWSAAPWNRDNTLPILFDLATDGESVAAIPTDAAWELVRQLQQYDAKPASLEQRIADLERRVMALEQR